MKLDHVGIQVADLEASAAFYDRLFNPTGLSRRSVVQGWIGFGTPGQVSFWIGQGDRPPRPTHVAFEAPTRSAVDDFHRVAVAMQAQIKAPPAVRPEYHATFYSAMVLDPDGHNIELVCHDEPTT